MRYSRERTEGRGVAGVSQAERVMKEGGEAAAALPVGARGKKILCQRTSVPASRALALRPHGEADAEHEHQRRVHEPGRERDGLLALRSRHLALPEDRLHKVMLVLALKKHGQQARQQRRGAQNAFLLALMRTRANSGHGMVENPCISSAHCAHSN
jgi:hypothetical protein